VVIRENDEPSVVLIRHTSLKGETVWALPKGQLEPGEQPQDAALREVLEETGLEAEIVGELDHISYWFAWPPERVRYHKTVHFFLMRMRGGDPAAHDSEVEEVAFVSLAEAPRRATHSSERELLQRAAEVVAAW
jgi:ADP-ribose pyrophosphatase YjhB (NUDIX family)